MRDRDIIAQGLLRGMKNPGWQLATDNTVPPEATMYVVYDGMQPMGGGLTTARGPDLVARCAMPIVFWR